MDIGRIKSCYILNNYSKNSTSTLARAAKKNNTDTIEISNFAKSISNYVTNLELDSSKKINDIKTRIENSTYNIDARLTAKSILNSIKEKKNSI